MYKRQFQERVKVRTDELQQMYGQRGMTLPEGYVSRINQEVYSLRKLVGIGHPMYKSHLKLKK